MRACLLCLIAMAALPVAASQPDADTSVRDAIVAAVRERMGNEAEIRLDALRVSAGTPLPVVQARPDPGARLGGTMRFNLATASGTGAAPAWSGSARADVYVAVEHLHARRAIARGTTLSEADVERAWHEVEGGPLRPWPTGDLIGRSRAIRAIGAGSCIPRTSLAIVPLVQAGRPVQAIARVGDVQAEARLVAADNGDLGSIIRVTNPQSRRTIRARVVSAGVVEVLHD